MVLSDNGKTSRYTYNHSGERIVKSHGTMEGVYINGAPQGITFHETDEFTLYPASIISVSKNRFTKHYFIGSKRIASRIGSGHFNNVYGMNGCIITAGQQDYAERLNQIESQKEDYYRELGIAPGIPTMKGSYGDPENTGVGYNTIIKNLGDHSVPAEWAEYVKKNTEANTAPGAPIAWEKASQPEEVQPGYGFIPDNESTEETFYYHSDHLGSTSYVTDDSARITQYTAYLPYGELLVDEHSSSEDLPYKFNGKELDEETGLYYYGARYMQPITSVWYGIDPLTEKYSDVSAYTYCMGNPVKLVDSDGRSTHTAHDGTVVAVYDDDDLGVYRHNKSDLRGFDSKTMTVNGKPLARNENQKMGETWTPFGFADYGAYEKGILKVQDGAKIDFNSNWATIKVNELIKENPSLISYAYNARSKKECKWNFKGNTPNGNISYGSLLFGKYASARDAGNFGAGIVKARSSVSSDFIQYGYGKYNETGNSIFGTILNVLLDFHLLSGESGHDPVESYYNMKLGQKRMQNTIDYGENPLSQAGINAGFEYWKKINIKSKK
ncbi:MAG: RHS repeat-associated core domain-containing protein [Bacteroidaceae bacterium]|nr:RHS repeat-associated core domain-containing protein [Bacteroidaceae bacterium]